MFGGIAARQRLLVVADCSGEATVRVFDLEDRRIASRFSFEGEGGGYTDVGGIALAPDSSLYVPDTHGGHVRRFSLFGNEVQRIGAPSGAVARDRRGILAHPRAVCVDSQEQLWVACGDRPWVHGLQVFDKAGAYLRSAAAFGERERCFGPALGLCAALDRIWVADHGNDCVQCFREDGAYIAAYSLPEGHGRPVDVVAVEGRRAVLVQEPTHQVLLADREFRFDRTLADGPPLDAPSGLAVLGDELLVLDRDGERVLAFDMQGRFVDVVFDASEF